MSHIIRVRAFGAGDVLACSANRLAALMAGHAADRDLPAGWACGISELKLLPPEPKIGVVPALTIKYVPHYDVQ